MQEDSCRSYPDKAILQALYYMGWYLHQTYYGSQHEKIPDCKVLVTALEEFYMAEYGKNALSDASMAKNILDFWRTAKLIDVWKLSGQEYVHFHLQTFQEYAVACWLNEKWQKDPPSAWNRIKSRLHHYAWREPILLLVGIWESQNQRQRVNELLIHLLKGPSPYERYLHRDLRLAATLLGEIASPDKQLTQEVIKRISNIIAFVTFRENPSHELQSKAISWISLIFIITIATYISILIWPDSWMAKVTLVICMVILVIISYIIIGFFTKAQIPLIEKVCWLPQLLLNKAFPRADPFIEVLGDIGEPAISALAKLVLFGFGVMDSDSRPAAVETLRRINRPDLTIPILINSLGNISAYDHSISSYNPITGGLRVSNKARYLDLYGFALSLIARFGQPAVSSLVEAHEKFGERPCFSLALGLIDDPKAAEELYHQFRHPDPDIGAAAAEALGRIGDLKTAPFLLENMSNDNAEVQMAAALALGKIGNLQSVNWLMEAMKNGDPTMQKAAVSALGMLGKKATDDLKIKGNQTEDVSHVINSLLTALNDPDPGIVVEAVHSLGSMRAKEAVPSLIKMLDDSVKSLDNILPTLHALMQNENLLKEDDELSKRFEQNCVAFSKGLEVIKSLGEIGDPRATDILIEVLEDISSEDLRIRDINQLPFVRSLLNTYFPPTPFRGPSREIPFIREAAAKALGKIGGIRARDALVNALSDNIPEVSEAAIEALGHITDAIDQNAIIPLLQAKRRGNNLKLCMALKKIGDPAVTYLTKWLQEPSLIPSSRMGIIQMLGIIGDPRSEDFLIHILQQPKSKKEREFAAKALAKIGTQESIYALTETLGYNETFLCLMAVETIGEYMNIIQSIKTARSIMWTLWWRKLIVRVGDPKNLDMDEWEVRPVSNWDAMDMVANRISVLSVEKERAE